MPWERIVQARTTLPRGVPRTPTEGCWFDVDETVVLRSGERDEWHDRVVALAKDLGVIPRGFRGRFDTARHVETKLAVRMRYKQRTEEVVLIDRPVCGTNTWDQDWPATCDKVLRRFLPPGGILRVVQWDGTVRTYRGQETESMTLRAVWDILRGDGTVTGARVIVRTPADVTELVSWLSESGADTAKIVDTSTSTDAWPDHMVHAVVADRVGYLSHWDADHDPAYTKGDPTSRAVETRDESFPPGSGVSLEKFTAALTEFFTTGKRPICVQWWSQERARHTAS